MAQTVKNLAAMQETLVRPLGWEDPLKKEMATHSSILARRIPWTEEPSGLYSVGSQTVVHDWVTKAFFFQPSCWSALTGWGPSVASFTPFIHCPSWTTFPTELTCFQSESYSRYHGASNPCLDGADVIALHTDIAPRAPVAAWPVRLLYLIFVGQQTNIWN